MARQKRTLRFALTEDDSFVRAILSIDGARILDAENEQAPSVSARHPIVHADELLGHARYWSGRKMGDVSAWLMDYVGSRERDVAKEILATRKSLHKIAGIMKNAQTAKKLMNVVSKVRG